MKCNLTPLHKAGINWKMQIRKRPAVITAAGHTPNGRERGKMAKSKQDVQVEQVDPQDELIALRQKVADLEQQKKDAELAAGETLGSYVKEMDGLRKAKSKGLNEIKVKENFPEYVSLWHVSGHNVGKRVGPIDANNAEYTFLVFAFYKIRLSLTKPTEEWIGRYKQTQEYIVSAENEKKRRERKAGTKKSSEVDRLIKLQAMQLGVDPETMVSIRPQEAVKGRI